MTYRYLTSLSSYASGIFSRVELVTKHYLCLLILVLKSAIIYQDEAVIIIIIIYLCNEQLFKTNFLTQKQGNVRYTRYISEHIEAYLVDR